jgi:hypothetical protein
MIAPLQTQAILVEIRKAADRFVKRYGTVVPRLHAKQVLVGGARMSALRHWAARRAPGFRPRRGGFLATLDPAESSTTRAVASSLEDGSVLTRQNDSRSFSD